MRFIKIPRSLVKKIRIILNNMLVGLVTLLLVAQSNLTPPNELEQVRVYTRNNEFDYITWTLDALLLKVAHGAVDAPRYMDPGDQNKIVLEYLDLVTWINRTTSAVSQIYADPNVKDPAETASELSNRLQILKGMETRQKPIVESILQYQVSVVVGELGLGRAGQPIPPVLYHVTSLPNALIVSPRDVIRQKADISLLPDMTAEEIDQLEQVVEKNLDVSALVVPVGGVGTYPTMVMSTTNLSWLLEVISHEWIHNFLTLHPLGINYYTSPQLRTMNETTANLAGKEIGWAVLQRFYPKIAATMEPPQIMQPEEESPRSPVPTPTPEPEDPNEFRFNREMNRTRIHVDELLSQGKIEEAEAYMEMRRQVFWENGYRIRRLNQAYFAFYGAYADSPGGGAAGRDPVGPAVQQLRRQSNSVVDFLNRIAWITSFEQLQAMIEN